MKTSNHSRPSVKLKNGGLVRARATEFKARRAVTIPCTEGVLKPEDYLKEVDRVVKLTFPDSSRMKYMGQNLYRLQILPITFFTLTATPLCDIKVYYQDPSLRIRSDRLVLDGTALSEEIKNLDFGFRLQGDLRAVREKGFRSDKISFSGSVSLRMKFDVPVPFSFMPEQLVSSVGDDLLDRILGVMESQLLKGIARDYMAWCREQVLASQRMMPTQSQ